MEFCTNHVAVCIVPKQNKGETNTDSHGYSSQRLFTSSTFSKNKVVLKDDNNMIKEWAIDHIFEPDASSCAVNDKLVNWAMQGYDVAALFIQLGDFQQLYEQQQNRFHSILGTLQANLDKSSISSPIKVEYAYIEISGDTYRDIRKDREYSRYQFIEEGGFDTIMKKVYHLNKAWTKVEQSREVPSILVIKLTDEANHTVGHLTLINLLQPDSISIEPQYSCHKAYVNLCDIVHSISENTNFSNGHIDLDNHVIIDVLAKYLCGQNKMTFYACFNDTIDSLSMSKEMIKCLDMLSMMRSTPVKMLKNIYSPRNSTNFRNKTYIEKMKEYNKSLKSANEKLEISEEKYRKQAESQNITIEELQKAAVIAQAKEKVKDSEIRYLKIARQQTILESNIYSRALLRTIDAERALTQNLMSYMEEYIKAEKRNISNRKILVNQPINTVNAQKSRNTIKVKKTRFVDCNEGRQQ